MSRRSKKRHRQQLEKHHAPRVELAGIPVQIAKGGTKGHLLWIGGAMVAAAAILYAVSTAGGGKGGIAATSATNTSPLATSAPVPALLSMANGGASVERTSGPKIVFATPVYDFGRVKSGEFVKYTYVFTNVGGTVLQVDSVQASCGCTTAGEWTRDVGPGRTGSIPVQFNSSGFSGWIAKSITVSCNDTNQPKVGLQFKGIVWKPIDVIPQFAVLSVTSETPSNATTVSIVSNEEAPLTLSEPESSSPVFAAELKTSQGGKVYQLMVKTVPPLPAGNVQAQITLKTSSTNAPVIRVNAVANVQPVVAVTPSAINLPAGPLTNAVPSTISIRNNGTNALTLSEPGVNGGSMHVQLKEVEPGRFFTLALNFPAGFEMAQGDKVEVSVKSNHPQFPMIMVPVVQAPRAAPVVALPAAAEAAGAGAASR